MRQEVLFHNDKYYISRPCETLHKCVHCSLQNECEELFDSGKNCEVIKRNYIWMQLDKPNVCAIFDHFSKNIKDTQNNDK